MPIKGLTDNHQLGAGLPRLGTLYKGDEKPESGNKPGKDLDFFRFEAEPQFEYLREKWAEIYSDKPVEFSPVFIFGATAEAAFESWMEEWSASGLMHRCDGEQQVSWFDKSIGLYSSARIACEAPQCQCKRTGRLRLLFPDFIEASGVLGYVAITTHSVHDILTLHRYLADVANMYGKLEGVPFVFGRAKREVTAPKPGDPSKRLKTTKSLLYMHVLPDFTREQLVARISSPQSLPALESGRAVSPEGESELRSDIDLDGTAQIGQTPSGNPRLSSESTNRDRNGGSAEPPPTAWTDDPAKWNAFLASAEERFHMTPELVNTALKRIEGLPDIPDWTTARGWALAAVVAYGCDYNPEAIGKFTSTLPGDANANYDLNTRALKVAQAVQAQTDAEFAGL